MWGMVVGCVGRGGRVWGIVVVCVGRGGHVWGAVVVCGARWLCVWGAVVMWLSVRISVERTGVRNKNPAMDSLTLEKDTLKKQEDHIGNNCTLVCFN